MPIPFTVIVSVVLLVVFVHVTVQSGVVEVVPVGV